MAEQYVNSAISTLSSGINNSVGSLTVASGSVFPSVGNFRIRVDNEIMLCTARSSNTLTVTRGQEGTSGASHSSGARVALVHTAGTVHAIRQEDMNFALTQGRVGIVSGAPESTADNQSTLYFTPWQGNKIALYDDVNARWFYREFSEISVAVPSTIWRMADIFVYDNAGTLTMETVNWNQTTAVISGATNATPVVITSAGHGLSNGDLVAIQGMTGLTNCNGKIFQIESVATDTFTLRGSAGNGTYNANTGSWYKISGQTSPNITTQNSIPVRSGATNKKYVGCIMTQGTSGQVSMNASGFKQPKLLVANEYNRLDFRLSAVRVNSHTYGTAAWRPWDNDSENQAIFVVSRTPIKPVLNTMAVLSAVGGSAGVAMGVNVNNSNSTGIARNDGSAFIQSMVSTVINRGPGPHVIWPVEIGSGTATFEQNLMEHIVPM